jgi:hypothetical protein
MQSFLKQEYTENDIEHGVYKVSKTAFNHVTILDGPNEYKPIHADQRSSYKAQHQPFGVFEHRLDTWPLLAQTDTNEQSQQRPDDPMANDFKRINAWKQFPVKRKDAPENVSQKGL